MPTITERIVGAYEILHQQAEQLGITNAVWTLEVGPALFASLAKEYPGAHFPDGAESFLIIGDEWIHVVKNDSRTNDIVFVPVIPVLPKRKRIH